MRVRRLSIENFRGIRRGTVNFPKHALLVGGNNVGKSTICEALDLVLGPERMWRRPVVDEHDFYRGRYMPVRQQALGQAEEPVDETAATTPVSGPEIRINAILLDLSEEAERRFAGSLRPWDENQGGFIGDEPGVAPEDADAEGVEWGLQVCFIGRYNDDEDDFEGSTFLAHPERPVLEGDEDRLGAGLQSFTREHKKLCGFVFLRALRTGSRALSLQKGSLLDTILRLHGDDASEMWVRTLAALRDLEPSIGEVPQLQQIQQQIRERASHFVGLTGTDEATAFFASDLTRETLREFVRLFVATKGNDHLLPFQKHGTGTVNVLVFALLTFIAEMKEGLSVIFAMEEPEIALPPHTQRRICRFVLREMGQAIVTSHSPYVIEQFGSSDIVVLTPSEDGVLRGTPLDDRHITERLFRSQRRQFAEAVLAEAVVVVEGATEVQVVHAVSSVLERLKRSEEYVHIDLAGVTVFDAGSDSQVPRYGPVFRAMEKYGVALFDSPRDPWSTKNQASLDQYEHVVETAYNGIEDLLVAEIPEEAHRRFLDVASGRNDYPQVRKYNPGLDSDEVLELSRHVLIARKGANYGYASLLIESCETAGELPDTIVDLLVHVHDALAPMSPVPGGATPNDGKAPPEPPS